MKNTVFFRSAIVIEAVSVILQILSALQVWAFFYERQNWSTRTRVSCALGT